MVRAEREGTAGGVLKSAGVSAWSLGPLNEKTRDGDTQ